MTDLWQDNFDELLAKFHQIQGDKWAGGGMWFCWKCGSQAKSREESMPCQSMPWPRIITMPFIVDRDGNGNPIIPVKVRCVQYPICDSLWHFKTAPCACESPKGCVEGRDAQGCKCVEK